MANEAKRRQMELKQFESNVISIFSEMQLCIMFHVQYTR